MLPVCELVGSPRIAFTWSGRHAVVDFLEVVLGQPGAGGEGDDRPAR